MSIVNSLPRPLRPVDMSVNPHASTYGTGPLKLTSSPLSCRGKLRIYVCDVICMRVYELDLRRARLSTGTPVHSIACTGHRPGPA